MFFMVTASQLLKVQNQLQCSMKAHGFKRTTFKPGKVSVYASTFMLLIKIRISFAVHLFLARELSLQK